MHKCVKQNIIVHFIIQQDFKKSKLTASEEDLLIEDLLIEDLLIEALF